MCQENDAKANSTKESILDTCVRLFAKFGYARVSMRDIASAVGVQAASIYYYFKSKEDILESIFQTCVDERRASLVKLVETMEQTEDVSLRELLANTRHYTNDGSGDLHDLALLIAMHDITFDPKSVRFVQEMLFVPIDTILVPFLQRRLEQNEAETWDITAFGCILKSFLFSEAILKFTELRCSQDTMDGGFDMIASMIPLAHS